MKILWLTNIKPHIVSRFLGENENCFGGWLDDLSDRLLQDNYVSYVYLSDMEYSKYDNGFSFHSFSKNSDLNSLFYDILSKQNYDIINIWGSEYIHALIMHNVAKKLEYNSIILSIQGIVSEIAKVYDSYINYEDLSKLSIHDFIKHKGMIVEKDYFYNNGKYEVELLKQIKFVIGRTDWDQKIVTGVNSNIKYFRLNDSLRDAFYQEPKWNYFSCQKHSIFITQAQYPIKGFHLLLQAVSLIKYKYPDIKVYVAGNNPFNIKFYRLSSYQLYIKKIIKKYGLQENIQYLGFLNQNDIKETLLKVNLFISPSTIENESNSMCEAMLTGTPIVASNVGGISSILTDGVDGYLYDVDDIEKLSSLIDLVFSSKENINIKLNNVIKKAYRLFDRDKNYNDLINIYNSVIKENNI